VIPAIFDKLGTDYPGLEWLFVGFLGNFAKFVGIALVGIRLARNPSGVVQQILDGFRPLRSAPVGTAIWIVGLVVLWALAWQHVIANWTFALIALASMFVMPALLLRDDAIDDDLDLIGLSRPFAASDLELFERELALPVTGGGPDATA